MTVTAVGAGLIVIILAALSLKRPAWERWYISRLSSTDVRTRREAAEHLAAMGSVRAIPHLVRAFSLTGRGPFDQMATLYAQKESRAALVSSLGITSRTADGRVLSRPSRTARSRRVQLTTLRSQSAALDFQIARLAESVLSASTYDALVTIARTSTGAALPRLALALESEEWPSRWLAVHVLGALDAEAVDAMLQGATGDENEHVRHAASAVLAKRTAAGGTSPGVLRLPVRRGF